MVKVHGGIYRNIQYESTFDKDNSILHVLDLSGMTTGDIAYKTVTNGIDELLPYLKNNMDIDNVEHCFLYGTDNNISAYNPDTKAFAMVTEKNNLLFERFNKKMNILYENGGE